MNLYLFPESAISTNGYGIACEQAYKILQPVDDDIVVWYTNNPNSTYLRKQDIIIPRPGLASLKRYYNMLLIRTGSELLNSELRFLKTMNFDKIHCDEVIFYRAIRSLFPNQYISVRFHNCYSRILERKKILKLRLNASFEFNLRAMQKLEFEIFRDKNIYKIFLSNEDKDYYTSMTGRTDASLWNFQLNLSEAIKNRTPIDYENKIVYFGGVESHKKQSLLWFINYVLPQIKKEIPEIQFYLWGRNTEQFNKPSENIFGYGFYSGEENMPLKNKAIYINPDIIGMGVKLKLMSYYNNGVSFITTPFGFEGYTAEAIDDKYCIVSEIDTFGKDIVDLLKVYK